VRITAAQKQLRKKEKKKRLRGSNFKLMLATNANCELLPLPDGNTSICSCYQGIINSLTNWSSKLIQLLLGVAIVSGSWVLGKSKELPVIRNDI
jgi:hypothetical protein